MEEKKVAYSVTKFCGNDNYRYKGIGKLIGNDLYMFGNKVLEDITKYCNAMNYQFLYILHYPYNEYDPHTVEP